VGERPARKKKGKNFVFTRDFGRKAARELLKLGSWLGKSDSDKTRTHFLSGY